MALLSMAAVSCTVKEVALEEAPTKVLTLGASVNQTKAAISDNGAFTWQAKISAMSQSILPVRTRS